MATVFISVGAIIIITAILSILTLGMKFNTDPEIARTFITKVIIRIFFIIFGVIVLFYGYHTKNQIALTLKENLIKSSLNIVLI